jgi:UDP-N-acetylmuramyl pentapeptide phosphotransferase/UDP-N-acetylglucosamine-1-phosphate transferase
VDWWSQPFDPRWWGSLTAVFALSAAVTWTAIRYAHRRNLIDQPGQRRSHSEPTPRGGGIGIVAATIAIFVAEIFLLPPEATPDLLACLCAVILVASVGWIDDHGGLAARWRFLAHCIAALLVLVALIAAPSVRAPVPAFALIVLFAIAWLSLVWSINLHNFMDGINGLLAFQALFVFLALTALARSAGADADAWHLSALAAAVAAFIPFNFPRARVFMGDVGSGALGLLIGIAVLRQMSLGGVALLSGVAACSAFVVDATCNLVSRVLRGKRWYSAHREHLYQWMVRAGMSHARVVSVYMGWNLLIVAPIVWLMNSGRPADDAGTLTAAAATSGLSWVVALYLLGIAVWIFGKRWCLQKVTSQRHAAA